MSIPANSGVNNPIDPNRLNNFLDTTRALNQIRDYMRDGLSQNEVNTLSNTLQRLDPKELNDTIGRLSAGEVTTLLNEMDGASPLDQGANAVINGFGANRRPSPLSNVMDGGLSRDQRRDLMTRFARDLDASNITRVMAPWREHTADFANAIATHSSDDAKRAAARSLATQGSTWGAQTANIISSIKDPKVAAQTLSSIPEKQLQGVMAGASQVALRDVPNRLTGSPNSYRTADPWPLFGMLTAAARTSDPTVKARVFAAGAEELTRLSQLPIENPDALRPVRQSLTNIIRSDVDGVVGALGQVDPSGKGLSQYMTAMLSAGDTKSLNGIVNQLTRGPNGSVDPKTYLNRANGDTYQNAQNLGYFLGAIDRGFNNLAGDLDKQSGAAKNLLGAVFGAAGAISPQWGVSAAGGNLASGNLVDSAFDDLKNDRRGLANTLLQQGALRGLTQDARDQFRNTYLWISTPSGVNRP